MKPTLEQVIAFAQADLDAPKIPTPHEVALALSCALLTSGKFGDDHGAAIVRAWTLIPDFYGGQVAYERHVRMLAGIAGHQVDGAPPASAIVSAASEPEMTAAEARAMVAGEQGGFGEFDHANPVSAGAIRVRMPASEAMDLSAIQARQARIAECTTKVIAAKAVLEEAEHHLAAAEASKKGLRAARARVAEAQKVFDQAAAEQSKAYE